METTGSNGECWEPVVNQFLSVERGQYSRALISDLKCLPRGQVAAN